MTEFIMEFVATWVPFLGGRPIRFPEALNRGSLMPLLGGGTADEEEVDVEERSVGPAAEAAAVDDVEVDVPWPGPGAEIAVVGAAGGVLCMFGSIIDDLIKKTRGHM